MKDYFKIRAELRVIGALGLAVMFRFSSYETLVILCGPFALVISF